jgi:hypothetical protein
MWAFGKGDGVPMGPLDAADGVPTIPCPECGANTNPIESGRKLAASSWVDALAEKLDRRISALSMTVKGMEWQLGELRECLAELRAQKVRLTENE